LIDNKILLTNAQSLKQFRNANNRTFCIGRLTRHVSRMRSKIVKNDHTRFMVELSQQLNDEIFDTFDIKVTKINFFIFHSPLKFGKIVVDVIIYFSYHKYTCVKGISTLEELNNG
jgi:hypothetical protein